MARILLRVGDETCLSTDAWRPYLIPYAAEGARRRFVTLPVPSSIPRCDRADIAADCRRRLLGNRSALVGHFGTYGTHVAPMLRAAAVMLLTDEPTTAMVCMGAGSEQFVADLVAVHGRSFAPASMPPAACPRLTSPPC